MMIRFLLLIVTITLSLVAAPNISDLKAAVQANPDLLNSPQAKAMMAQQGLSAQEVKKKLQTQQAMQNSDVSSQADIVNSIDMNSSIYQEMNQTKKTQTVLNPSSSNSLRINPFRYKTSEDIIQALRKQQLGLTKKKLQRYSSRFFANKNVINPTSIPTPDDYIISNGDKMVIYIYGDRDTTYTPTVSNDGTIELPFVGPIHIGGMRFKDAKKHLTESLRNHFKLSDFYINMEKYSTIQVTLVGDVKAPGLYNLASFSTVKDLLLASKGLHESASVRKLLIKRNGRVIKVIDFYDLLFKARRASATVLKHGDIVVVKKAQILASVDGYVNDAAIFELKPGESLRTLIDYAGGMKPDASKTNIRVKRYVNNTKVKTFTISYDKARRFHVVNGDEIYIYPLSSASNDSVNIYGNIIRPGTYQLPKDKSLNTILQKYTQNGLKRFFLPNTYFDYAVIKRYNSDLEYSTRSFSVQNVLQGKQTVHLYPQDEIFFFSKNDIFTNEYVITKGANLIHPGQLQYFAGMSVRDAVNASGIDGVIDDKVKVTTFNTPDLMPKTQFYSLKNEGYVQLSPYDEVEVFGYYDTHVLEPIRINGEVVKPLKTFYEKGMNVADLIDMAGGLTPKAYRKNLEIVRYYVDANQTRHRKIIKIDTTHTKYKDILLQPYDVVNIFRIPNWSENKTVTLKGEVRFPGTYTIETGEKLSSVIERAGGFTKEAFIQGAVFTRESVRKRQIEQYNKSLARIKRQLAVFNAMPANAKQSAVSSDPLSTLNEVMSEAKKYQPIGRVSIALDTNITKIKQSEYDLVLQDKDTLIIPAQIDTVTVFGEVFNPTSFIYHNGMKVSDYINMASGFARGADVDRVYIIHADGTSEPAVGGWWIFSSSAEVHKGDTIVVPMYIKEYNNLDLWESVSKILASFAVTAATLNTLGVF